MTEIGQERTFAMHTENYDEVSSLCPPLWPSVPDWTWVNLHDGSSIKDKVAAALLHQEFGGSEVVVIVHSTSPFALRMSQAQALSCISHHLLSADISVADPIFSKFLSISTLGLATADA